MVVQQQGLWRRIKQSKGGIVVVTLTGIFALAWAPVYYHVRPDLMTGLEVNFVPKHDMSQPLPRSAAMRGAYVNTGSRDIGRDKPISDVKDE